MAAILSIQAESHGADYDRAEAFLARGFEFSADEIHRLVIRFIRIMDAGTALRAPQNGRKRVA